MTVFAFGDKVRIVSYPGWQYTLHALNRSPVGRTGRIEEVTSKGIWIDLDDGPVIFVDHTAKVSKVKNVRSSKVS